MKRIAGGTFEVKLTATIQEPWHIYSQNNSAEVTLPTQLHFAKNPLLVTIGSTKEIGHAIETREGSNRFIFYNDQVEFIQVVKVKAKVKTSLAVSIDFMTCTNEMCLPVANQRFSISINNL